MRATASRVLVPMLVVCGVVGCGKVTPIKDGTDAAAGSSVGGGAGGATAGASGATGGATAGESGATAGAGGATAGAGGATAGAGGATAGAGGATAGAGGATAGAGGATGGAGGGGAGGASDGGAVDAAAGDGGADAHDAAPRCDAGSTFEGGACVPIVVVVATTSPCQAGGDVIYFDGDPDNYIFKGKQTVTQGKWSATASSTQVHVHVDPTNTQQGLWWDLYFDSSKLGAPLAPQVYTDAMRWPFQTTGHPGLDVSGDGRGCNMVTGRFQIEDLSTTDSGLTSFTASFEHHCEGGTSALRGCVHFEM
jgi:hypothetical protein